MTVSSTWAFDTNKLHGDDTWDESTKTLTVNTNPGKDQYRYQYDIEHIIIGKDVDEIGQYAFHNCTYVTTVTFAAESKVDYIDIAAFCNCIRLTSIEIPAGVSDIHERTFQYCTALTTVTFAAGANIDVIDKNAFNSTGLTSITLPDGVTEIRKQAFYNTALTSINIPEYVEIIEEGAFNKCPNLETITVDDGNTVYTDGDCNAIIKKSSNELLFGCKNTVIPASVTSIGKKAFWGSGLTSINIPNNVTVIGEGAFQASSLTSINIPASVTNIGEGTFNYCKALETITVDDGNTVYTDGDCNAIIKKSSNMLLFGCKNTVIPASVTSIGKKAFLGSNLTSYTIPANVTSIGESAFEESRLTSVTIAEGVKSIGKCAFNRNDLTSVNFPASVTSIGECVFLNCNSLTTVTLNSNPHIDDSAFNNATVTMNLACNEGATGEYWTTFYNENYNFKAPATTQIFKAALDGTSLALTELKEEDKIVSMNNAVILKSTTSPIVLTQTWDDSSNDFTGNSLQGVNDPEGLTANDPSTTYVLNKKNDIVGFYKLTTGKKVSIGKAYLTATDNARGFFGFEAETTNIEHSTFNIEHSNDAVFDLQGRKVSKPVKGLYIVNGKKMIVK